MTFTRTLLVATVALLTFAACGSDSKTTTTTATSATTVATTSAAAATTSAAATTAPPAAAATTVASGATAAGVVKVSIGNFVFQPATISVPVGGTITWTNDHTQPHTATSAGNFDTGSIAPGESKTVTFATAGTFSYICSFHPFMTGMVTVA